jgi:uncharacterized protein
LNNEEAGPELLDNGRVTTGAGDDHRVFRVAGVSYLRIPAPDPKRTVAFYAAVFDWRVNSNRAEPSFEDGTGHVIGHFIPGLRVAGEAGVRPYIFVESVDGTLERIAAHGGEVVRKPYPEGNLRVATFHDPAGNEIGIWELSSPDG